MWKNRNFRGFLRPSPEKSRFSGVFRGFSLALSKMLGYSAQRLGFFGVYEERIRARLEQFETYVKKSGG
jgi:hypothetical protein